MLNKRTTLVPWSKNRYELSIANTLDAKPIIAERSKRNLFTFLSIVSLFVLTLGILANTANAEQKKTLGDWDVHYMVLNTTFLQPEIARINEIERSGKNALVNISVLKKQGKEAQEVEMSGTARNLLGNTRTLNFKQVKEGKAIYYLATVPFSNKEVLRFDIDINQGRSSQNLKFQQTMYTDD